MSDQPKPATHWERPDNWHPKPATDLEARITDYLAAGGLFNPELMAHEKVRDLLMDCREALYQPKPATGEWTVEYVIMELGVNTHWKARDIADAHNAHIAAEQARCYNDGWVAGLEAVDNQLAAEREEHAKALLAKQTRIEIFQQQLAAERSLRETAQSNAELWHEEMLKADKQLTAEREKVQTLQDALNWLRSDMLHKEGDSYRVDKIDAALAKMK